ncbi:GyrI-like domain-containing protein [Flavobacteriales bacterium]|nr:GyrI-like domain-containing protein [Flavobacteriales bacterium]
MKKALIVIGGLVLVVWGLLMSQGLYSSIEIEQGEQGGFILLGMDHIGPYQEIGTAFEALRSKFPEGEFSGVYFDDPETVPADSLHSFAGMKVSAAEAIRQIGLDHSLRTFEIEQRPAHFVNWGHGDNMVGIIIGTMKAYPALTAACEETGWSGDSPLAYEDYSSEGIRYVMQY